MTRREIIKTLKEAAIELEHYDPLCRNLEEAANSLVTLKEPLDNAISLAKRAEIFATGSRLEYLLKKNDIDINQVEEFNK